MISRVAVLFVASLDDKQHDYSGDNPVVGQRDGEREQQGIKIRIPCLGEMAMSFKDILNSRC